MSRKEEVKKSVKDLIKQLHEGKSVQEVKEKFKDVLKSVGPVDIAQVEEELIREGMPAEEVRRLCDVHIAIFREQLEKQDIEVVPGHPIHTFMEEHKIISRFLAELKNATEKIRQAEDFKSVGEEMKHLERIVEHLMEAEKHNVREENVLFPYLEKHGITQPPAIMWSEHNELRERKKKLHELVDKHKQLDFKDFVGQFEETTSSIIETLSSHIYKENNILYPTALRTITEDEWKDIRRECDELGYCCFTPIHARGTAEQPKEAELEGVRQGQISFEAGSLSNTEIEAILDTLPIDITFVDREDTVQYFNKSEERIFPRTKAVIGRKVQLCHPQKSIHVVNEIVDNFRRGKKDTAEFWIQKDDRLIYIRYFAVRDGDGRYLGTMEVTQDLTDIKKIDGEKRLLDWKA